MPVSDILPGYYNVVRIQTGTGNTASCILLSSPRIGEHLLVSPHYPHPPTTTTRSSRSSNPVNNVPAALSPTTATTSPSSPANIGSR